MNNMDYLNQISGANNPQPQKQSIGGLFSKKFLYIIGGLLILAILLIILGSIIGKSSNKDKDLMDRINLRITNLGTITQEYGRTTKSSSLRSVNASLYSVLNNTSATFTPVYNEKYITEGENVISPTIQQEEDEHATSLRNSLNNAKINGLLDRTYAREITLEISLLLSLESEAIERTKYQEIKDVLNDSYTNLNNVYTKFYAYSDTSSDVNKGSN